MRLVECGDVPIIKNAFHDQTLFFPNSLRELDISTIRAAYNLLAAFRSPETSLIICHAAPYPVWHWQWISRNIFSRRIRSRGFAVWAAMAIQLLRVLRSRPVVVLDFSDSPVIEPSNLFLLDRCTLYFKRELPTDSWRALQKTLRPNLPTPRFRNSSRQRDRIAKLRPLSLGLPTVANDLCPMASSTKKSDVFFAGQVTGSSTVRERGMRELLELKATGLVIDVADRRMSPLEFYRRCSESWLVWSPEGLGWDCFRHYEALAAGSVPVINLPTVQRYMPLVDGQHALYYEPREGELARVIAQALSDKQRLVTISECGQKHVMQHHTHDAIARYVVETANDALHSQHAS